MTTMAATTDILERLPMPLTMVLRNINTVRAVHLDLGGPVNRLARMTVIAIDGSVVLAGWKKQWVRVRATVRITMEAWKEALEMFLLKTFSPDAYKVLMELMVAA